MSLQSEFHAALEAGDVRLVRKASLKLFPHLPQPTDAAAAEASMHMARTQMPITFKARAYSHAWLTERGMPSQLPDELKPKAERLYPRIASAVFISANTQSPLLKPVMGIVQNAMSDAVLEAEADGKLLDAPFVRARMQDARVKTFKQLLGTTGAR